MVGWEGNEVLLQWVLNLEYKTCIDPETGIIF